jgi:hypothetical protein
LGLPSRVEIATVQNNYTNYQVVHRVAAIGLHFNPDCTSVSYATVRVLEAPSARGIMGKHIQEVERGSSMGRELRIVGFVVLAAIAVSFVAAHNNRPAKPIPVPLPIADETKPEPPKAVRVIQIYKTSDQLPVETTAAPVPVDPISAFPETATMSLPEILPSSLPTISPPPPTQKAAADFCERFHLHKVFTKNGKSWRCLK